MYDPKKVREAREKKIENYSRKRKKRIYKINFYMNQILKL